MNLTLALEVLGVLGGFVTVGGAAWKMAAAWTKKAEAIGRKAAAEEATTKEVEELRKSIANCLARVGEAESKILVLQTVERVERRARADTKGIPIARDDGE